MVQDDRKGVKNELFKFFKLARIQEDKDDDENEAKLEEDVGSNVAARCCSSQEQDEEENLGQIQR